MSIEMTHVIPAVLLSFRPNLVVAASHIFHQNDSKLFILSFHDMKMCMRFFLFFFFFVFFVFVF